MGRLNLIEEQIPIAFGADPAVAPRNAPPRRPIVRRRVHPMLIVLAMLIGLAAAALVAIGGWELRRALWHDLLPLRNEQHLQQAFSYGLQVVREAKAATGADADALGAVRWIDLPLGLRAFYERIPADREQRIQRLDLPPLRVAIAAAWVNHLRTRDPAIASYPTRHAPSLLRIGSGIEASAAVLTMLIVIWWVRRGVAPRAHDRRPIDPTHRAHAPPRGAWSKALLLGLIAAALVWLNPAVLINGHIAPAWDAWLVPLVLLVVLLASMKAWLLAGAAMVLACLMQGHAIYVAPLLVLWPLANGRFADALRTLTGFIAMAALIASPWLVPSVRAWAWIGCMVAFAAVLAPWVYPRRLGFAWWIAAAFAICVIVASAAFDSGWPWMRAISHLVYERPDEMYRGPANNLPALLSIVYGWSTSDMLGTVRVAYLGTGYVNIETMMIALLALIIILCGIGAALHARRNDPQLLAALITPWLAIFVLLPGMHERWIIWAAALSAIGLAASVGLTLLHLLVSVLAAAMILHRLLLANPDYMPNVLRILNGTHPGLAWAMLLCLGVMLYLALVPRRSVRDALEERPWEGPGC